MSRAASSSAAERPRPGAGPQWAEHWRHRAELPKDRAWSMIYVSARRISGEELAFVRVRPTDHVGAVRAMLSEALLGTGTFLLSFQGRILRDAELAGDAGLKQGSIVYVIPHESSSMLRASMDAEFQLFRAVGLPDRESEENLFAARHLVGHQKGVKRVLTVP
mmetsp:Transcript_34761/g.99837  ORF Transcript_34761/g.99837 Transcript_34761/m.99837 type:complete len:163 (+) Transcript_34761:58-546(+)